MKFERTFKGKDVLRMMGELTEWFSNLLPDKIYRVEVKEHREKRSLDANAYAWLLIGQLAKNRGLDPDEVYRACIRKSGGTYVLQPIKNEAVEKWAHIWTGKGAGWMVDEVGPAKTEGYTIIRCWYGSSVFDTKEMSNLIDNLVQDAQALGIDTTTPQERQRLVDEWAA